MWGEIKGIFRQTILPEDKFWVRYASRPPAAVLVYFLKNTPVTPNQVSFASVFFTLASGIIMATSLSYPGLLVAIAVFHLSYVLDCVDGQLARLKNMASDIGPYLDFFTDELRAYIFFGSVSLRLYRISEQPHFLILGLIGMALIAIGIGLTTFVRRPEFESLCSTGGSAVGGPAAIIIRIGKFVIHYPSYVVYLAILNRMEIYFYAYLLAYVLHIGNTGLSVFLKLGRFHKKGE